MFPFGIPTEFSFVCSFRQRPSKAESWDLIRISDSTGSLQLCLKFIPYQRKLELTLPSSLSLVNQGPKIPDRIVFTNVTSNDGSWHKVGLTLRKNRVTLHHNCLEHSHQSISSIDNIDNQGNLIVAKFSDEPTTVPVSQLVDNIDCSNLLIHFVYRLIFNGWSLIVILHKVSYYYLTNCDHQS